MFWSCKIFQLNPKVDTLVKTLLNSSGSDEEYRTKEDESLKLYMRSSVQNHYGHLCSLDVDRIVWAYNREKGRFPIKITSAVEAQIFEMPEFSNYVGMFASSKVAIITAEAVKSVLARTKDIGMLPFFVTDFLLKEKEQDLRKLFDNMTEISIDRLRDSFVRKATLKGKHLGESEEYQKYVKDKDLGGDVQFFGVSVDDRSVILV